MSCRSAQVMNGPCATLQDGAWHHLAASFDGLMSRLYVDGILVDERRFEIGSEGFDSAAESCAVGGSPYKGEARNLRVFGKALNDWHIQHCGGIMSTESHCFLYLRELIEASPWFQRRQGRDHFVLLGGHDYPAAFDPHLPPTDKNYVLEQAWPSFINFMLLHFGARTERCAAIWNNPWAARTLSIEEGTREDPSCATRMLRTITIPPHLPEDPFDCRHMARQAALFRRLRVAYRGLGYGAMIERNLFQNVVSTDMWNKVKDAGWINLEFSNWTLEKLASGRCDKSMAFEGLCPWRHVGGRMIDGLTRVLDMRKRARALWPDSEFCLVLPGDGGYEIRLYSILNAGCIPVIVNTKGVSFPKLPFAGSLPWHEFAIFWYIDTAHFEVGGEDYFDLPEAVGRSASQLLIQLLAVGKEAVQRKRKALLQYAVGLRWGPQQHCLRGINRTAMDFLAHELAYVSNLPDDPRGFKPEDWRRKDAMHHIGASSREDMTGNGCPLGYPFCKFSANPLDGHTCHTFIEGIGVVCPAGCDRANSTTWCTQANDSSTPCLNPKCGEPVYAVDPTEPDPVPFPREQPPKFAILTAALHKNAALSLESLQSLQRFVAKWPKRYDLFVYDEMMLDERDFHLSWNSIAFMRRALVIGHPALQYKYDAVIWIADTVVISNLHIDPLYSALREQLFCADCSRKFALVSKGVAARTDKVDDDGVDAAFFAVKRNYATIKMMDQLLSMGRRSMLSGRPRRLKDSEASVAEYVKFRGGKWFTLLERRTLLTSFDADVDKSEWRLGDFAARFSEGIDASVVKDFVQGLPLVTNFTRPFWVGCFSDDASRDFKEGPHMAYHNTRSCAEACAGYAYMALQNGNACACGDSFATAPQFKPRADDRCSLPCAGENDDFPQHFCGAGWKNGVYFLSYEAEVDLPSPMLKPRLHALARRNVEVAAQASGTPKARLFFVGCQFDDGAAAAAANARLLAEGPRAVGFVTETCAAACQGFMYMGLRDGGFCSCGQRYAAAAPGSSAGGGGGGGPARLQLDVRAGQCGPVCAGEEALLPSRFCGAATAAAVYFLPPRNGFASSAAAIDDEKKTTLVPTRRPRAWRR
eukprot:TRINITY_DN6058_c1_g1_i1.p1 TRINITY_DN6058_c1_g1~~TRINITY_DN6058_c1_g1_i1.p1  ORF type:complete len:1272 (-),score=168.22 TRINITY_DN6058_c1_g1_i1:8-3292(-)